MLFVVRSHSSYVRTFAGCMLFVVRSHRLYVRTGCTFAQVVRSHRLYVRTGCTFVQVVRSYRLYVRTGCTYVQVTCLPFITRDMYIHTYVQRSPNVISTRHPKP